MSNKEHLHSAPAHIDISIITVSTSRTQHEDKSGQWLKTQSEKEGHRIASYDVVPDDRHRIASTLVDRIEKHRPHAVIMTGGTGIGAADVTIEAVQPMFSKSMGAFAVLFAQLSFETIDSAALLSRAAAGIIGKTVVFCLPGSLNACKLAGKELIFPEIKHIVAHLNV